MLAPAGRHTCRDQRSRHRLCVAVAGSVLALAPPGRSVLSTFVFGYVATCRPSHEANYLGETKSALANALANGHSMASIGVIKHSIVARGRRIIRDAL